MTLSMPELIRENKLLKDELMITSYELGRRAITDRNIRKYQKVIRDLNITPKVKPSKRFGKKLITYDSSRGDSFIAPFKLANVPTYKKNRLPLSLKNIPVRFMHWDWPFDIIEMPNTIKDKSMKFDGKYTFFHWTLDSSYCVDKENNDFHFNHKTHKLIAKRIIENIEELGLLKKVKYE